MNISWLTIVCILLAHATLLPRTSHGFSAEAVPVRVGKCIEREIAGAHTFIGNVDAARKSVVGSAVAGRVELVHVETGDFVDPDNETSGALVQLRLTTVAIQLRAAEAALLVSQQELAELEQGPRPEELRRVEAVMKGAEATREFAATKLKRLEKLYGRDATARANLDEATSAKNAAEQAYIAAQANHEAALAGTRVERLAQAKAKVAQAQEEVNRLQDRLDDHTVRAPFRGYVVTRLAEKGEWIQEGDAIAEIVQLDPVEVRVAVPEEFIARVAPGMRVRVDVAAVQSELNGVLTGTVFRIVPSADARSRSFPVRIRIDNTSLDGSPLLKPGMLARVLMPVGKTERALLVPKDALVLDRDQAWLFAIQETNDMATARKVKLEVGAAEDSLIQVRPKSGSRLEANMTVVTEGNERLADGDTIQVVE